MKAKLHQVVYTLLILFSSIETSTAAPKYAKHGCKDMCGNVRIPYPFGIGANCSVNEWYTVDCISSTPYLRALHRLQLLAVDLENQTVTVNTRTMISDCGHTNSVDLGESPFVFSKSHNKFVFEGCGNAVMRDDGGSMSGCSTTCRDDSVVDDTNTSCFGISCCQTRMPHHIKSYNISVTRLGEDGACGSAFLVDEDSYSAVNNSYVPVSLLWTLSDSDSERLSCCSYLWSRIEVDLSNGTSMGSWKCIYRDYVKLEGNPYLGDGCHYESIEDEVCAKCIVGGGFCIVDEPTYGDDGVSTKRHLTCQFDALPYYRERKPSHLGVILGISVSMGVLFLVATIYVLYKAIKKTKQRRQRKRFFKRNGGLLLKQQEEAEPSLVNKAILFTSRELERATDNFNENRILGRGGHGIVYKGMLSDGKIVAIKKSKIIDESQLVNFINEVVILSQVNHRNVVKLFGCCLETSVPILVSEFIPNGTLYDHLHNAPNEFPVSLNMRLRIATEVAGALAYLHSATSVPIYHRDIKTTNILLDDKYRAKVSDFGTSRFVSIDQTHLTTLVRGTVGYLDPEYYQSSQFTEKSDVYSFGVVLVELLTREKPISVTRFGEHRSLAVHFMLAMEEGRVLSIFDPIVVNEGNRDNLLAVANLAMRCLNLNGKYRPTMKEVAIELETIYASHVPSTAQTDITPFTYGEDFSTITYSESSSTFMTFDDSISN